MGKLTTEQWGNALVVMSAERKNRDGEPEVLGLMSVDKVRLSNGQISIRGDFEIRPQVQENERTEVQSILFDYLTKSV